MSHGANGKGIRMPMSMTGILMPVSMMVTSARNSDGMLVTICCGAYQSATP